MRSATKTTVSIFGVIAGLAGLEHGFGEILQGNIAPEGLIISSWPDSEFFRILSGEPAMTIIPNLLITGIFAIFFSLLLIVWVTAFIQEKYGGLVLILLSIALLLVGGGFGPPLTGIILGIAASKINAPVPSRSGGLRLILGKMWPWFIIAGVAAWILLLPGVSVLSYFFGIDNESFVYTIIFLAFGSLFLSLITASAYDAQGQISLDKKPKR